MYLVPFFVIDADLAARETRVMNLMQAQDGIPPGNYGLIESYCPDPACDCRRVMLNIYEEHAPDRAVASIGYGFDRDEPDAGPYLDPLNPQASYAPALLRLVEDVVLSDPLYVARLERHYTLVKYAASNPQHPAYSKLQDVLAEDLSLIHI